MIFFTHINAKILQSLTLLQSKLVNIIRNLNNSAYRYVFTITKQSLGLPITLRPLIYLEWKFTNSHIRLLILYILKLPQLISAIMRIILKLHLIKYLTLKTIINMLDVFFTSSFFEAFYNLSAIFDNLYDSLNYKHFISTLHSKNFCFDTGFIIRNFFVLFFIPYLVFVDRKNFDYKGLFRKLKELDSSLGMWREKYYILYSITSSNSFVRICKLLVCFKTNKKKTIIQKT